MKLSFNKIIFYTTVAILVLVILFFTVAFFLPSSTKITVRYKVKAPVDLVFAQVNTIQNWPNWNPFVLVDSPIEMSYKGEESGAGSVLNWLTPNGANGFFRITESAKNEKIIADVKSTRIARGYNTFEFLALDTLTELTWTMEINELSYPLGRYFGLIAKSTLGAVLEKGLENIEQITIEQKSYYSYNIQLSEVESYPSLTLKDSCAWSDISLHMSQMYGKIYSYIQANQIETTYHSYSSYLVWNEAQQYAVFEVGVPIKLATQVTDSTILLSRTPSGQCIKATHFGAYENTFSLYVAMDKYMQANRLEQIGGPWEVYVINPVMEKDTTKWQTDVFFKVRKKE